MNSVQAKADLHSLNSSSGKIPAEARYLSSNIDLNAFRDEGDLEVRSEPPLKKRKLGWIPTLNETNCDSVTLSLLKIEFSITDDILEQAASVKDSRSTSPIKVILGDFEEIDHHVHHLEFSTDRDTTVAWSSIFSFTEENGISKPLKKLLEVQKQLENVRQLREILNLQSSIQLSSTEQYILYFEIRLLWKAGASVFDLAGSKGIRKIAFSILETYFPDACRSSSTKWRPQDFYENVHIPSATLLPLSQSQNAALNFDLYPFQQRAVKWLLSREGVSTDNVGNSYPQKDGFDAVRVSFRETTDAVGRSCVVSHLLGTILLDPSNALTHEVRGGILAEEMGLGKTVELIALICLHRRHNYLEFEDPQNCSGESLPVPSGCTLIITPPSILHQWKSEITTHAPHLRLHHYQGVSSRYYSDEELRDLVKDLLRYDIILTTYNVLAREIWYATPIPNRNLRHEKKFKQRRSPLVQINWWRVCLDEAQMVEGGVSNAAIVARSIPRHNAWAITGTPLRRDHKDLFGLFLFLRFEPYARSWKLWERLITELKDDFKRIIGRIALRHTKDKVRHELSIPPQTRVVITMPFTTIEEQNYRSIFEEMCHNCDLSETGSPLSDTWKPNDPELLEKMRKWLVRLRQICLHPSTGFRNRRAFGNSSGPLRTVKEVLEVMIDNNASALRTEERTLILRKLQIGHILAFAGDDQFRAQKALNVYLPVLARTELIVQQYQKDLRDSNHKADGDSAGVGSDFEENEKNVRNQDSDQLSTIRYCMRQMLEVKHSCAFFVATAYYQTRTDDSITIPSSEEFHKLQKLEAEYYDLAKSIRTILLNENREKAKASMRKISQREFINSKSLHISYLEHFGGIESRNIVEKINIIFKVLNRQEKKLTEWKSRVQKLILTPLVDHDEEKDLTGEEYEDSTKQQDELYVLMIVLKAIVADRKFGITGQKNDLVDHEIRFKAEESRRGRGDAPELFLKLAEEREELLQKHNNASLRGLTYQLRNLRSNSQIRVDEQDERAKSEIWIIEKHMKSLQDTLGLELKNIAELERDLDLYRTCTNLRLEFYKQLQHLSDQVAPYKEVLDETLDHRALTLAQAREEESQKIVATLKTKQRFLAHVREENLGAPVKRACVICQCPFESGILTVCGHIYCKECIQAWWREHKSCPLCKKRLHLRDFHDISYKPQELHVAEEYQNLATSKDLDRVPNNHTIYSEVDEKTLNEIKSINLDGSYGTKTDMLARHLLWLRQQDRGLKSIIFSQYSDFLSLLGAFSKFKIGFSRITQKNGTDRFKFDPAIECFLLDSKANSSGLNLVQATHVFLCEPLINTAIELQAIARVHRIGQKRPTTVYMYLISDTVEESIYRISVARRLEHVKRTGFDSNAASTATATATTTTNGTVNGTVDDEIDEPAPPTAPTSSAMQENMLDAANSRELEHASLDKLLVKGKTGGEAVDSSDLWNCLFGNSQKQKRHLGVVGNLEMDLGHRFKEGGEDG